MTADLTERQAAILEFIERFTDGYGYAPSLRDIASAFDIGSTNGVLCHIRALEARGAIVRQPRLARSMRVVAKGNR